MSEINRFSGAYEFLSNFYPCKIIDEDEYEYSSVEAAFQEQKTLSLEEKKKFTFLKDPSEAKSLGRRVSLRSDWEQIKDSVMEKFVRQKFSEPVLKDKLLSTGDAILIEGNYWKDYYWGVCKGVGKNKLGKILMKIREELKS